MAAGEPGCYPRRGQTGQRPDLGFPASGAPKSPRVSCHAPQAVVSCSSHLDSLQQGSPGEHLKHGLPIPGPCGWGTGRGRRGSAGKRAP